MRRNKQQMNIKSPKMQKEQQKTTQPQTKNLSQAQNYTQWIIALAVVEFDIDEGQKVNIIVPDIGLTHEQQKEIAMLSFPDSNSLGDYEGTFKYIFKLKNNCFGYTCFKQKKDPQNPRGYSQKSFVVLSFLPFPSFFLKMTEFIVFKTFHKFQQISQNLQKLYEQTKKWPQPVPMKEYILPVLEYQLSIQIPNYIISKNQKIDPHNINVAFNSKKQFSLEEIVSKQSLKRAGRFQEIKLTQAFTFGVEILWVLWQSIILNKNIFILGNNPFQVSQAVLGAISLINPLIYCGQYSPYITVFDTNLKYYQNQCQNFIIGASNPLFSKLFNSPQIVFIDITSKKSLQSSRVKSGPVPLKDIILQTKSEEQKAINESTLRKYFYRLNKSIISQVEQYVNGQKNDLKFFNSEDFLLFLKKKKNLQHLEHLYEKKKYLLGFFEKLIDTVNFRTFLKSRNIHMSYS